MENKWEYKIVYLARFNENGRDIVKNDSEHNYVWEIETEEILNKLGEDRWELVQMSDTFLNNEYGDGYGIFKRKKI